MSTWDEFAKLRGWCIGGVRLDEWYKLYFLTPPGLVYEVRTDCHQSSLIEAIISQGNAAVEATIHSITIQQSTNAIVFHAESVTPLQA